MEKATSPLFLTTGKKAISHPPMENATYSPFPWEVAPFFPGHSA